MEIITPLIKNLEIASTFRQLPESFETTHEIEFSEREISILLGYASILSLAKESEELSLSYEIITRLIEYTDGDCQKVIGAADLIFSRIGNFPGRTLLRARHQGSKKQVSTPPIRLECLARETENTIYTDDKNSSLLTDFQYKLFDALGNEDTLSVSAPTSAGKSFVLNLDLIRKIKISTGQSIVYIVPTRALITEVSLRIRHTLKEQDLEDVLVRTAPFPVAKDKIKRAVVYVFTQERLMSFINSTEGKPYISSVIVDEAHEIQNGKRGIILQNAINITLSRFPSVTLLFASPLIKNPSYFLSLFNKNQNGKFFVEKISPVSQNIILVSEVYKKPFELNLSLVSQNRTTHVGNAKSKFKLRGNKVEQRANLALAISNNKDAVISFSNGPAEAENVARCISNQSSDFLPTEEIIHFADFLTSEIHAEYPLADCIKNGVAFHYGNMPSLVRLGVENLFKDGHIKIICCTSTLLQGVNLPAKHIIIENPKSGDNPMSRADFLNLAGRAGRLLHEFHGNIWCLRPSLWDSGCYEGEKLQEISSAISTIMEDGGAAVQELLTGESSGSNSNDEAEAAFGMLYHEYMSDPTANDIYKYRNESNSESLENTLELIKSVQVTLPLEIIENNQSLRPDHLQRLYKYLKLEISIDNAIPLSPYVEGAKGRMDEIFKIISDCFEWETTDRYRSYVSLIAYRWVWGIPIGKILTERVSYLRKNGSTDSTSTIIRGCLGVLENAIRFRLVKYFSAYIEILKHVALEENRPDKAENIEPFHIYLEFGSCNRNALNLMALGLSRFTALYLENKFDLSHDVEAEDYIKEIEKLNIDTMPIPKMCVKEIKELLR